MPKLLPKLFVIMPFGVHHKAYTSGGVTEMAEFNFDFVYEELIAPIGKYVGFQVLRIDEISRNIPGT